MAALVAFGAARVARADDLPAQFRPSPSSDPARREKRSERLGVLAIYAVVSAAVVGGSYLLRDDFVGRGVATTAAGWGGLAVGAAAGAGLSALGHCQSEDCADNGATAAVAGGLVGAIAGSIAGYLVTGHDGRSRVYTTGAGMSPFILILGAVTIVEW